MDESRKAIHVLIADAHTIFRKSLKKVLDSEPQFLVVGEASDGEEALKLIGLLEPDVLLTDWQLPKISGMDVLGTLSDSSAAIRTILLTAEIELDQIPRVFELGARGLVLKKSPSDLLFQSILEVVADRFWMGDEGYRTLEQLLKKLSNNTSRKRAKNFSLTQRELKIVAAVAAGATNKEIAQNFSISVQTVKHHITNIFDKLGVYNRLELTLFAIHHRLIQDPD